MSKLKFAEKEVREIEKLIKCKFRVKTKILTGNEANEDNIKRKDLKDYGLIHFAAHSRIEEKMPFHSSLLLTKTKKNDVYLKCGEIFNLDFNADLVVLSACKTAHL